MIDDPLLWNDWHPVASVHQLQTNPILSTRLLGEDLVIWQQGTSIQIWRDLCIHRGTKLSLGELRMTAGSATPTSRSIVPPQQQLTDSIRLS